MKSNQINTYQIIIIGFLRRGENQSTCTCTWRKTSRSRVENQQTQPTYMYDARSGNKTQATLAGASALTTALSLHIMFSTTWAEYMYVDSPFEGFSLGTLDFPFLKAKTNRQVRHPRLLPKKTFPEPFGLPTLKVRSPSHLMNHLVIS